MKGRFVAGLIVGIAIGGGLTVAFSLGRSPAKAPPSSAPAPSKKDLFLSWGKDDCLAALLPLPDGVFYLESNIPFSSNGWRVDAARILQMKGRDFSMAEVETIFDHALKKSGWQPSTSGLDGYLSLMEGDNYAKIKQFDIWPGPESPYDHIRLKIGFKSDGMTIDFCLRARKR